MIMQQSYVGVDISKDHLDLDWPENEPGKRRENGPGKHTPRARQQARRIANNKAAIAGILPDLAGYCVIIEATSVVDRTIREELTKAGIPYHRANPLKARNFAKAFGFLAKTDKVDATMLRCFGEAIQPEPTIERGDCRQKLARLADRRRQLVDDRVREKNRLAQAVERDIIRDIKQIINVLDRHIDKLEKQIADHIKACDELSEGARRLTSAPGVGDVTAVALLAEFAELGTCSRRTTAAIAGLAPIARDSGRFRGKRRLTGGRRKVRTALYMATLQSVRTSPRFKAYYQRLCQRGLAKKSALAATARKLLTILNAMLRDGADYVEEVPEQVVVRL